MFKTSMQAIAMLFLIGATASAQSERAANCLPDGESTQVCASVKLSEGTSMAASGLEDDRFSDDPMGEPTIEPLGKGVYNVCLEVTNNGGDLSGPNGEVQNGGGEGDCIEVKLEIQILYPVTISGGDFSISGQMARTGETDPVEVCPCR